MSISLNPLDLASQVTSGVVGVAESAAEATPVGAATKAVTDIL